MRLMSRLNSRYATSWKPTGRHFPMVWKRGSKEVHAVEVTARYVGEPPVPDGHGRLRILVLGPGGERLAVPVEVTRMVDGEQQTLLSSSSHDGSYDGNDHLTTVLPLGTEGTVAVRIPSTPARPGRGHGRSFRLDWDDTRAVFRVTPDGVDFRLEEPADRIWEQHVEYLSLILGSTYLIKIRGRDFTYG